MSRFFWVAFLSVWGPGVGTCVAMWGFGGCSSAQGKDAGISLAGEAGRKFPEVGLEGDEKAAERTAPAGRQKQPPQVHIPAQKQVATFPAIPTR